MSGIPLSILPGCAVSPCKKEPLSFMLCRPGLRPASVQLCITVLQCGGLLGPAVSVMNKGKQMFPFREVANETLSPGNDWQQRRKECV